MFDIIQKDRIIPKKPRKFWGVYIQKNINEIIKVQIIAGKDFLIIFLLSFLFQENIGPIPITRIAGSIIGIVVELKYGSPTDILLFEKISIIKGYIVPKNTVAHTTTIIVLFNKIEPSLLNKKK